MQSANSCIANTTVKILNSCERRKGYSRTEPIARCDGKNLAELSQGCDLLMTHAVLYNTAKVNGSQLSTKQLWFPLT